MAELLEGRTGEWEIVLGLEVHAQIISESKLFSGASTTFGSAPNAQVSVVDAAMPGMLPVLNRYCVEQAVKTGLGLKAQINLTSVFERKNYFYADLPQGYQISQYLHPIVGEGIVYLDLPDGSTKEVGIERLHMEQDAGKSMHDQHPKKTYVDLNRSGVALMEIVSKPDMRSGEEAGSYLRKLRSILRYLGCERLGQEAGRRVGHALRDQERQLHPLRPAGHRLRGAPPDRGDRGRRRDRAGDPPLRQRQGRHALHALQGARARLPLFPRSRPVAAGAGTGLGG